MDDINGMNNIDYANINYEEIDKQIFEEHCKKNIYNHKHFYQPVILPKKERIIVIGDIHGDYNFAIDCLIVAHLIKKKNQQQNWDNDNVEWIGGNTVVVQIGDIVDRCRPFEVRCEDNMATIQDEASDVKLMKLFNILKGLSRESGGDVFVLIGNHELMNVMGKFNYTSNANIQEFEKYKDITNPDIKFRSAIEARRYAFRPGGEFGNFIGCAMLPAIIIGEFIFVHAGIIPEFTKKANINKKKDLQKIAYNIRRWLLGLINKDYVGHIVNSFRYSMFWDRILGTIPPNMNNNHPECQKYLKPVLKLFKAKKMIIGHTPQFFMNKEGINGTCDNQLIRVDVGGSKAFIQFDENYKNTQKIMDLRRPQVLEITDAGINILKK